MGHRKYFDIKFWKLEEWRFSLVKCYFNWFTYTREPDRLIEGSIYARNMTLRLV